MLNPLIKISSRAMKTPAEVYGGICPQCKSDNLTKFDGQLFCQNKHCGWESFTEFLRSVSDTELLKGL